MIKELKVRQTLEWYDGIVVALVVPSWREETFLATLLSWSQKDRQRRFALIPLSLEELLDIEASVEQGWGQMRAHLTKLRQAVEGTISVVMVDDATNQVVSVSEASAEELREGFFKDVEEAINSGRES
jgi:hypothetical protein